MTETGDKFSVFRRAATMAHKPFVRETFFIFLCATVIGLTLSAATFNPLLIPKVISQNLHLVVSPAGSYSSSAGTVSGAVTLYGDRSSAGASFRNVLGHARAPSPDALDKVLAKTADENKTVIITALNGAWAKPNSMVDLFMQSFYVGEGTQKMLDNLLFVALDAKAYNRCLAIHSHCYKLKTSGVDFSAEKVFMSEDYLKMMWRRLGFLAEILQRGYNFIFSDADIMWLRDPFPRLSTDADIQITSDRFNGRPYDVFNLANSGYLYVRSNDQTIRFYRYWYLSRKLYPDLSEQNVLNIIKFRSSFGRSGLKFMFLDTKHFGGFCERSLYLDDVYTMHANCCKGLKAKLIDLRQTLHDWMQYKSLPQNTSRKAQAQWKSPDACLRSWGGNRRVILGRCSKDIIVRSTKELYSVMLKARTIL